MLMHPRTAMFATLALVACVSACKPPPVSQTSGSPTTAPRAATVTVLDAMSRSFMPSSNSLWELAGKLYNDDGNIDSKQLTEAEWQALGAAAAELKQAAAGLADSAELTVAPQGAKLQNEGSPGALGAAQVQQAIDAAPEDFRAQARQVITIADDLVSASATHDAKKADEASTLLNDVCSACHARFWYPNQASP